MHCELLQITRQVCWKFPHLISFFLISFIFVIHSKTCIDYATYRKQDIFCGATMVHAFCTWPNRISWLSKLCPEYGLARMSALQAPAMDCECVAKRIETLPLFTPLQTITWEGIARFLLVWKVMYHQHFLFFYKLI